MSTKWLIVNADDFGLSGPRNAGIMEAHRRGIVTSASILVYTPGFREAVKMAKLMPALDLGLHLNLSDGEPLVLGHKTLVSMQPWPEVEPALLVENTITLPVQINGKKRADVTVPRDAGNSDIEAAVLTLDAVKKALDGKAPKKVIVVPQRIVNVVA